MCTHVRSVMGLGDVEGVVMSIFRCDRCGCVENTATSEYWTREDKTLALCSQCDPATKKWHGKFDRISAKGFILYSDGFLYTKEDVGSDNFKYRMKHQGEKMVREILEEGVM
jgi:hypothetical protein